MLIKAYTDGSACVKGDNKGKGGFGTFFPNLFGKKKAFSLGFINTKTGRMEIMALLYAIRAIPINQECILKVFPDSEYIIKAFTEKRLEKWVKNNWITYGYRGGEQPVKNIDLWKKVLRELEIRKNLTLTLEHVKAHQLDKIKDKKKIKGMLQDENILGNFVADKLADYKRFNKHKIDGRYSLKFAS